MASGREDALPGLGRASNVIGEISGSVKKGVEIVAALPSAYPKVSPHSYKFSFFFLFVFFKLTFSLFQKVLCNPLGYYLIQMVVGFAKLYHC